MKKFLIVLLAIMLFVCALMGLTACVNTTDDSGDQSGLDDGNNEADGTIPPGNEKEITVKAYIDDELYATVYTSESESYKIIFPTVSDDITTNPNSDNFFTDGLLTVISKSR